MGCAASSQTAAKTTALIVPGAKTILHLDASNNLGGHSRKASKRAVEDLVKAHKGANVVQRDISELPGLPNGAMDVWFGGETTAKQDELLKLSKTLVAEVQAADIVVIGSPIYNFGPSTGLKGWIDQIARMGITFEYVDGAPVGMLKNKRAIVLVASGGTKVDSKRDHHTPWLRTALEFVGIEEHAFVPVFGGEVDEAAFAEAIAGKAE